MTFTNNQLIIASIAFLFTAYVVFVDDFHCPLCPDSYAYQYFNDNDRSNVKGNVPDTIKTMDSFTDVIYDINIELEQIADSLGIAAATLDDMNISIDLHEGQVYLSNIYSEGFRLYTVDDFFILMFEWHEWQSGTTFHYTVEVSESSMLRIYALVDFMYYDNKTPEWFFEESGLEFGDIAQYTTVDSTWLEGIQQQGGTDGQ